MKQNAIHIMGLGWLGLPLAETLMRSGAKVSGCVTTVEKQRQLQRQSIDTDVFELYKPIEEQLAGNKTLASRFKNATLILNIPPGRRSLNKDMFITCIITLIDYAMDHGLHKLIFVSTTSVFGEIGGVVDNETALLAKTESGKAHQVIEAHLASHYVSRSNILRPTGLVGPNSSDVLSALRTLPTNIMRHPIYSLCHKTDIPNGNDPVNLVHQFDVIQAIVALLTKDTTSHAFNLCSIEHPSRQEYYQWCAEKLSLPIPTFLADTKKRQLGKLIDAIQTYKELGLTPLYPSPYTML
jgi:nucleoside-diphosphate-sugar epimerase